VSFQAARILDLLTAIAVVAGVMMLVRPGSKGPALAVGLGVALDDAIAATIGWSGARAATRSATTASPSGSVLV
jgi:hypothetical protein